MKKVFVIILSLSFLGTFLFSQEREHFEESEVERELSASYESEIESETGINSENEVDLELEDSDGFDDFDSIFDDAEDIDASELEEEKKAESPVQIIASAFSSMVHFSGSFSGEVGLVYVINEADGQEDKPSGYFNLSNSLNMTVSPGYNFVLHGTVDTGIGTGFSLSVSSLYFDYLLFDRLYITAGKRSISWGNLRLFNDSAYYGCGTHSGGLLSTGPRYVDIFAEDGANLSLELRYPWSFGTISFATTGNQSASLQPDNVNYYGSIEVSLFNTNINLFAKHPERASAKDANGVIDENKKKNNLVGLELKRTILGFDVYGQGIAKIKSIKNINHSEGYQYIVATAGLYRLWDSFDPNIGFNFEYQHEYNPATPEKHFDRLAFEGGVKRIGKRKNMKVGIISHYNITEKHGFSGLTFIVSGICPYADWNNKFAVGYGSKYQSPIFMFSSAITLSLSY